MSYGSAALGSTSLGGVAASQGMLFSPSENLLEGVYRRSLEYLGGASFFQVETRMETASVSELRIARIYSHNDPSETPQLQVTVGADGHYTQSIIGAARFIVVDLEVLDNLSPIQVAITGSEYFQ